jgi:putative membrane protein
MRGTAFLPIAAAALLAGCASNPPPPPPPPVDTTSPLYAPNYLSTAASGDQFEIQSSQLAMQRSTNAAVRSLAQMLITDHGRMSQQMIAAAQAAGLTPPPPTLLPEHAQMLQQLQAAPAGSFDMSYRTLQVAAHQQALQLHQNYAASGDNAALRTVAAGAVPVIQQHLNMAQSLQVAAPLPPTPPPAYEPPARPGERG